MLLRRVMEHVKTQNWFAVLVDFVIVVFGVFVGLQVQEWNNQRQFENQEIAFLREMQKEIQTNNKIAKDRDKAMEIVIESGERAIAFLEKNEPCETQCWPVLVDFFIASQAFFAPSYSNVYEEMKIFGLPQSNELKGIVDKYYVLSKTMDNAIDNNPKYRLFVREILPVNAHRVLWSSCHRITNFSEEVIPDCPQGLPDQEISAILEKLQNEPLTIGYLNYWIGMHTLWGPIYREQIDNGEMAIEAINNELRASD